MLNTRFVWMATLTAFLLVSATSIAASSGNVVVIANKSLDAREIGSSQLKKIFLGKKTKMSNGRKVHFVVLAEGETHEEFLAEWVRKTPIQFLRHWRKQVFTGKGNLPQAFTNEDALVAYVAATEGAIGYVGPETDVALVDVLEVK